MVAAQIVGHRRTAAIFANVAGGSVPPCRLLVSTIPGPVPPSPSMHVMDRTATRPTEGIVAMLASEVTVVVGRVIDGPNVGPIDTVVGGLRDPAN